MRHDKRIAEREHDSYKSRGHLADPTVCSACGATYHGGRWTWSSGPADAARATCPACRRIRERYPAGIVTLRGAFLAEHRDEIVALARHVEEREKREHPLHRIMAIAEENGATVITTTDSHLARAIASAVSAAYKGDAHYDYADEQTLLRVTWQRD